MSKEMSEAFEVLIEQQVKNNEAIREVSKILQDHSIRVAEAIEHSRVREIEILDVLKSQYSIFYDMARKAGPLSQAAYRPMDSDTFGIAGSVQVGVLLVLVLMLRWPDWSLPCLFTRGFR